MTQTPWNQLEQVKTRQTNSVFYPLLFFLVFTYCTVNPYGPNETSVAVRESGSVLRIRIRPDPNLLVGYGQIVQIPFRIRP